MKVIDMNASQLIEDNMMSYSAGVLLNRAIPDIRDGLKPSYRHILFSMYKNKTFTYTKSRAIDGEVSKIHPNGSSYPTMIGMAQGDRHHHTLLDGDGWWGSYTSRDLTAAADRYTNAKMSDWSKFLFRDVNKGIVDFIPNYDGTIMKPEVVPVPFPLILTMAQSGIGVGFSSKTASHNVNEVADVIIDYLKTDTIKPLTPDFPTGGLILKNKQTINSINKNGSGSIKIRAKAEIEGKNIIISEIPYGTTREAIIDRIVKESKTRLPEVSQVQDLSGKDKFEINIRAKRGSDMEVLLEKLYKFTPLESNYSINSMVLVDGLPKQLGTQDIIRVWTNWRLDCVEKDVKNQIKEAKHKINMLTSYKIIRDNIEKVIEIIRFSDNSVKELQKEFKLNKGQAEFINNMQLKNLNEKYLNKKLKELDNLIKHCKYLEKLNQKDYKNIIIDDMEYVKKHFGHERKSKIVDEKKIKDNIKELHQEIKEELIDNSDYWVHCTKKGFVYKTKRKADKITLVPKDRVISQMKLNNVDDEVFAYTKDRNGVKIQLRKLEVAKPGDFGYKLVEENNLVDYGFVSEKFKYIVLLLESGRVVKFDPESYRPGTNVFKPTHTDKFEITHVLFLNTDKKIKLENSEKDKIILDTAEVRVTKSRTGTGQYIDQNKRYDIKKIL